RASPAPPPRPSSPPSSEGRRLRGTESSRPEAGRARARSTSGMIRRGAGMAEDAGRPGQQLEGPGAGRRFGFGEGLALAMVVLGDEGGEIAADARPRLPSPAHQRLGVLMAALDGPHEMGQAETVGERVRVAQ